MIVWPLSSCLTLSKSIISNELIKKAIWSKRVHDEFYYSLFAYIVQIIRYFSFSSRLPWEYVQLTHIKQTQAGIYKRNITFHRLFYLFERRERENRTGKNRKMFLTCIQRQCIYTRVERKKIYTRCKTIWTLSLLCFSSCSMARWE